MECEGREESSLFNLECFFVFIEKASQNGTKETAIDMCVHSDDCGVGWNLPDDDDHHFIKTCGHDGDKDDDDDDKDEDDDDDVVFLV